MLAKYLHALRSVNGSDSHAGLDPNFQTDWKTAASDTVFQQAQDHERDRSYFNPSVQQAKNDGLKALGQFIYYDAIVMHGPGNSGVSFGGIRKAAMAKAKTPAQGGNEVTYLNAFLDAARGRDEDRRGAQRRQPRGDRAARVAQGGESGPEDTAELEGVRGQLLDQMSRHARVSADRLRKARRGLSHGA